MQQKDRGRRVHHSSQEENCRNWGRAEVSILQQKSFVRTKENKQQENCDAGQNKTTKGAFMGLEFRQDGGDQHEEMQPCGRRFERAIEWIPLDCERHYQPTLS